MMKMINSIACVLSAIGAINWGLVAFLQFDLVKETAKYLSMIPHLDKIVYGLVAVSGIIVLLAMVMKQ